MSSFPTPRSIRSNWKVRPINLDQAAAEISARQAVPERYGRAIEARSWEAARGWRKGMLKRVDVAYEGEGAFASIRLSGQFYTLRFGPEAVR